jgi:cytochrome c oxidase subunit 4
MSQHNTSHHFIPPVRYYLLTLISLLILTAITVVVTRFDLGTLDLIVALVVAAIKASLVLLFFMGLRWDKGLNIVIFIGGFFFLLIFIGFTLGDIATRGGGDTRERGFIHIQEYKPQSSPAHH